MIWRHVILYQSTKLQSVVSLKTSRSTGRHQCLITLELRALVEQITEGNIWNYEGWVGQELGQPMTESKTATAVVVVVVVKINSETQLYIVDLHSR